ncbi:MAG: hypothetical protein WC058_09865 [Phycisphaeraceae bacterium]
MTSGNPPLNQQSEIGNRFYAGGTSGRHRHHRPRGRIRQYRLRPSKLGNGGSSATDGAYDQLVSGGVNPTANTPELHDGLNNYLFVDAHVAVYRPDDTVGTGATAPYQSKGFWTRFDDKR